MPDTEDFYTDIIDKPNFVELLFEEHELDTILRFLDIADYRYHDNDNPIIADEQYDAIIRRVEVIDPTNRRFIEVGSDVRGGKVKLPYPMGSLNQKYENDVQSWVSEHNLKHKPFIITDKLDGTSAMTIYLANSNDIRIAYSRGNGTEGADITRHLSKFIEKTGNYDETLVIRGEVILTKDGFNELKTKVMNHNGTPYRNARNMVAGLMNSKTNDPVVYDYLCFVAYEIVNKSMGKQEMLELLSQLGFLTPRWSIWVGKDMTDTNLIKYLQERRKDSPYEIDGIVIDVDDVSDRQQLNPSKETLNPEYSFKYKIADDNNYAVATVKQLHLNVSKHGYIKPTIEIEPVELVGVTVTKCTGFNMKFISDNYIGPGAIIAITRSGDVIPLITKVITPMPQENM